MNYEFNIEPSYYVGTGGSGGCGALRFNGTSDAADGESRSQLTALADLWGKLMIKGEIDSAAEDSEKKGEEKSMTVVRALKGLDVERIVVSPHGKATIVFWGDGSKTIVKRAEDEEFDLYAAFTAAVAKKIYGTNSALKKMIYRKVEYQKEKRG